MSIEMKNPKTVYEKIDAAANLVEQMNMAHVIRDENHFKKAHKEAGDLLFRAMRQMDDDGSDSSNDDGKSANYTDPEAGPESGWSV